MYIQLLILSFIILSFIIAAKYHFSFLNTKEYDKYIESHIYEFIKEIEEENKILFTEEDVKEAIEKARIFHIDSVSTDDIIQDLKQSKTK